MTYEQFTYWLLGYLADHQDNLDRSDIDLIQSKIEEIQTSHFVPTIWPQYPITWNTHEVTVGDPPYYGDGGSGGQSSGPCFGSIQNNGCGCISSCEGDHGGP